MLGAVYSITKNDIIQDQTVHKIFLFHKSIMPNYQAEI